VDRIRCGRFFGKTRQFIGKVQALSESLRQRADRSSILLIGIDEQQPLTILEGNHRLTAAMLASPQIACQRFRFLCGFSPRMTECCWYQTNLANLWRYARNRLTILMYDREADIARLLAMHPAHDQGPRETTLPNPKLSPPQAPECPASLPVAPWTEKQAS
jgi:hypothetical protein